MTRAQQQPGMTLKQFAAARFNRSLQDYREALQSKDTARILAASIVVYCARRNNKDRTAINRVWREQVQP